MAKTELVKIELRGVQVALLDEPEDAQVWVSLGGSDVPASSESFCWAGGDTRAEAIAEAVRLFREVADRLEALEQPPSTNAVDPSVPDSGTPSTREKTFMTDASDPRPLGARDRNTVGTQTQPARWRGEVKVQAELESILGPVKRRGTFRVSSQDGSIYAVFESSKKMRTLMNSRKKAHFKATLLGDGTLDIRQEVPVRRW